MANASVGNAYIPGGGGGAAISAGTNSQNTGTVVFSNSNGVSFGLSNGVITATVTPGAAAGIAAIGAGTQTATSGTQVFSNSNNISFGLSGSTRITASANPGVSALSAGTTSVAGGNVVFSNSNGVSFGLNGSTITASVAAGNASVNFSAGTTSGNLGSVVFSNSNGVSFGLNGSTVTGSVAAQSVQTQNAVDVSLSGNTSGVLALVSSGTLTLAGGNNITLSQAGNAITISGANAGGAQTGISGLQVSNTTYTSGTITFQNANGISFGSSGANGISASYTVPTQTNQSIGVYGSSQTTGQSSSSTVDARSLSLVGAGNISVGLSGGSVVISGAAGGQTNQTIGLYASSQTTGQSSSSTVDARSLTVVGAGVLSVGMSAGSLILSSPGTTVFANLSLSAGTTSNSLGSVVFSNSNGVSFGLNGSTITASVAAGGAFTGGVSTGGNTSGNTGTQTGQIVFAGGNNITLSVGTAAGGAQTITISGANAGGAQTGISGLQVSNTTYTSGTVTFQNANGISFGSSGANGISASYTVPTQTNQTAGLYAIGNTTQNSSTTLDARTLSFNGLGALTVGYSNGSIQLSAPVTSSLSATGGLSISTNGSTISIGQGLVTRTIWPEANMTAVSAFGNASMSFQYFPCAGALTASRMDALMAWTAGSSATTNTCAVAMSMYGAIYTRNGSSLSSLSSGSTQTTYSYASNTAGRTELLVGAIRPLSVPININMSQGEYFVGFNLVTATSSIGASTTNCPQTFSIMGGNALQSGLNYNEIGSATNASVGLYGAMGVYNAASTGLPASVSIASIIQTGASLSQANYGFVLRNA